MSNMFRSSQATSLDLSNFNTSNLTNMSYMFYNCVADPRYARTQAMLISLIQHLLIVVCNLH